jgi:3',5'-cyclic AMP phosphodiesterase CpdA
MRSICLCLLTAALTAAPVPPPETVQPFGKDFPNLDALAVGAWWEKKAPVKGKGGAGNPPPTMQVARDQVIAFALYTQQSGVLKLTAQLYPLYPEEAKVARLEVNRGEAWIEVAQVPIKFPGWSAHFRVEGWDGSVDVAYRVRHGESAKFEGLIRRDPIDKETIVVANMSCNSSRTTGERPEILGNLLHQNPDLLFFAGDQTYRHTEHTAGWIEFGLQFRDVMRDRPTICIPDDHDVGHPNLWGEGGKRSERRDNSDGGYYYPVAYVNMVQRQQAWHLPDAFDPTPVQRGISVYYTRLKVGGMDFAILEDRKFKSGPLGKIPEQGPRPDHVTDTKYDPKSIDLPGLQLLGERQLNFLAAWSLDWAGVRRKAVLSSTAFVGAVHMHGRRDDRLLADLDCNGWPQSGRNEALRALRRVQAVHLCGDQHLGVTVKHGIEAFGDGPYALTSPALVNTIYGRWWHPQDEKAGPNAVTGGPLPWTGDYLDGLGNKMSMLAYANPGDIRDERQRADGYGIARFHLKRDQVTFECWPRFSDSRKGDTQQFPGWPQTFALADNDGRKPTGYLPSIDLPIGPIVVQVIVEQTGETLYVRRLVGGQAFSPPVFAPGKYTVHVGIGRPDRVSLTGQESVAR